ncbi:ABC transporter permease [Actinomadura sp. 7K534]|uniref:ABC transporter permease n=1 Tax=Actinomadura sp. 7K534 TaxID=2530366 RepID=UPI0010532098|nr:ABC transporter permease [Actinomadura sp. 7K534]TDB93979.1 ABC transporter permease [Actinomadura sp. 7K534]
MTRVPRTLRRALVPIGLIALWQLLAETGAVDPRITSSPWEIVTALTEMIRSGELAEHMRISLFRAVAGLACGATLATIAGIAAGLSRFGEDALDSTVQAIRTMPYLGMVPLFILWFGLGEAPRITMVALGSFFPVYLNVFKGIRDVDDRLIDLGRGYRVGRWELIRDVIVPGAMPSALVGLRYALGTAWMSLVVAEQINAQSGLGYLIVQANILAQTSIIITALAVYAVIGILADAIVRLIERRALRWRRTFEGA